MSSHIVALPLEVGTSASRASDRMQSQGVQDAIIDFTVSNLAGSPEFDLHLEVLGNGGEWVLYWTDSRSIDSDGHNIYTLGRASDGQRNIKGSVSMPVPFAWRIVITYSGTGTADTEIGVDLLT